MAKQVRVFFEYKGEEEGELDINLGDIVTILQEDESGWSKGKIEGRIGWFPSSYYEPINEASESSTSDVTNSPVSCDQQQLARERLRKRYEELIETEGRIFENMNLSMEKLDKIQSEKRWNLDIDPGKDQDLQLFTRMKTQINRLKSLHADLHHLLPKTVDEDPLPVAHAFECLEERIVASHAEYQTLSSRVILLLQKRAGCQVMGDRAVGTLHKASGTLAADLAELQDLLVRPTQRVTKYQLFFDEMVRDARVAEDSRQSEFEGALKIIRRFGQDINDTVLVLQKQQRVELIRQRVKDIPEKDFDLVKRGREFLLDHGGFAEEGRQGLRRLFLFTDGVLVCKPSDKCGMGFKAPAAGFLAALQSGFEKGSQVVIYSCRCCE